MLPSRAEFEEYMSERPLIGITMRYEPETERTYLVRFYAEAVERAGGAPVHIALIPEADYIESVVARLDGVLLPGSASDVDPLRYGREPHPKLGSVHTLRDETDGLILGIVEQRKIPLLAICYGLQAWNVSRGGTLIQDIATQMPDAIKHEQGAPRERRSHRVRLAEDSLLANCAGGAEWLTNSHHHQAIETLGDNLRAVAWSSDGLVEACEDTREDGRWAVGVQWHPEIDWANDRLSTELFARFIDVARGGSSRNTTALREAQNDILQEEAIFSR